MSSSDSFWLNVWEWIAAIGVWVVIIGIIGEGAEMLIKWLKKKRLKKLRRDWEDGFRWFMAVLARYIRTRELEVETIAFAMVIAGLVAEFWGGQAAQQILGRNNARLNSETTSLQSSNLALSLRVEELRKANDELEIQLEPRSLRGFDADGANPTFAKFSGTRAIIFCNKESRDIFVAEQIFFALKDAGWNVDLIGDEVTKPGVAITCFPIPWLGHGSPKQSDLTAGMLLFEALTNSDIKTSVDPTDFVPDPSITFKGIVIQVGPKPTPTEAELIDLRNILVFGGSSDERIKASKRIGEIVMKKGPTTTFMTPASKYPPN